MKPEYRLRQEEYSLQGYVYKTLRIESVCPKCFKNLSDFTEKHLYCICCGTEINRDDNDFCTITTEFHEYEGNWLTNNIEVKRCSDDV